MAPTSSFRMWLFDKANEQALRWLARLDPTRREIFLAVLFLLALLAVGTDGYMVIEGSSVQNW